jgi:hypothetical protein
MLSSAMLRRVALVRADVSKEHSASIIRAQRSSETFGLKRATQRNIPEDGILQQISVVWSIVTDSKAHGIRRDAKQSRAFH